MKPPQEPSEPSDSAQSDFQQEFSLSLEDVERSLVALKQRYAQVQHDQLRQAQQKQRFDQVKKQLRQTRSQELKAELKQIENQLEALDNALGLFSESYLMLTFLGGGFIFSKSSLKEVFWQVVRFGGLGVVVGWILKSCAG